MDLSSLSDQEKESLFQVTFSVPRSPMLNVINAVLFQFREEMKNDSLEDSSDSFLLRWLVGELLFLDLIFRITFDCVRFSSRIHCKKSCRNVTEGK